MDAELGYDAGIPAGSDELVRADDDSEGAVHSEWPPVSVAGPGTRTDPEKQDLV